MAKRRTFTPEFKAKVVVEVISGSQSAAEVCRRYSLKPQLLSRWKAEFIENVNFRPSWVQWFSAKNGRALLIWNGW